MKTIGLAFLRRRFVFFPVLLLVTSCCCLNHLSADDETTNVLKRPVKNFRARFGSFLYIENGFGDITSHCLGYYSRCFSKKG